MQLDSLKKLFHRPAIRAHHGTHRAVVAPYRHWSYMLLVASVSVVTSMGLGAYLFVVVSRGEVAERPQLEEPERLVDHVQLRTALEEMDQQRTQYEELRGPLPERVLESEAEPESGEIQAEDEASEPEAVDARLELE